MQHKIGSVLNLKAVWVDLIQLSTFLLKRLINELLMVSRDHLVCVLFDHVL